MITIGGVAKQLNINIETIRFYQREGLIEQPEKPASGYRKYDDALINKIKFILKAKSLGFTLKEIQSLLSLSNNCNEVQTIAVNKLVLIREKIADLQKLEKVVDELTQNCQNNSNNADCPIIKSLTKT